MLKRQKFVNQYTRQEFNSENACLKSERKSRGIAKLFAFWKKAKDDANCDFGNGHYCYQRTEKEYKRLIDAFYLAMIKYEKWISSQFSDGQGILKKEYINGKSFIGRYLDDNNSELNDYWCILGNICPKCFREYGQMYFANHCHCDGNTEHYDKLTKCPTKQL